MGAGHSPSMKGQFLIAMPGLMDPNFYQTLTCIAEHTAAGAVGLVVNRVHAALTGKMIFDELEIPCSAEADALPVFIGGPVHEGEIFVLHTQPFDWEGCLPITASMAMTNTKDILMAIASGKGPESFALSLGCAGWGEGQLESEIKQNAWLTSPVSEDVIFKVSISERWSEALKRMGVDPSLLSDTAGHA